ncbi:MAG: HDOD domain-containing protein [Treponema sp.]|nr:HDOD domain-containing protein [Treponema sp.]
MASEKVQVDVDKIRTAIESGIPLTISTYTLPHEMELYIEEVLRAFLGELNQLQVFDYLSYCLKELINNAKKANTKRVYFEEKGLDINNPADYEAGMKGFKNDTLTDIKHYLKLQKEEGLYIKLILQTRNNKIKIEIRNRAALTCFEYKRIHDKLSRAQMFNSIEECMHQILDDSEGAGLGLVMLILMLRKEVGLTEENFQVLSESGETITRLIIPFTKETQQGISMLSEQFVQLIDGLPEFPENIAQINQMLNSADSKMSDIALKISSDVSLTAELLRLVNSAAFSLSKPCETIVEAVKFAGLRGISNLLVSIGTMKNLMVESDAEKKKVWDHSYRVAFCSYNLARNFCSKDRQCVDDSYVCGLLHDMGKVIFATAHPELLEKISNLCNELHVSADLFERMVAGVNHGEIGALIAEKWNFPEVIINVIRYHHEPEDAPKEMQRITKLVYLADLLVHYQDGIVSYDQFETSILEEFGIKSEEQLHTIAERLKIKN